MPDAPRNLLCVANFPSNTGFAWDFIEGLYAGLADRLEPRGVRTWVAYPLMESPPRTLEGSPARAVEHRWSMENPAGKDATLALLRDLGIGTVYLSDHAPWSRTYPAVREVGVGRIVVHDHTSGDRTTPRGPKRWLKDLRNLVPGALADRVIAVSDFVAERKVRVDRVPRDRVTRIWNSVEAPSALPDDRARAGLRARVGVAPDRPLVACVGRAAPEKGIQHLLRAFDRLHRRVPEAALLYMGDGPHLPALEQIRAGLDAREAMLMPGYVEDAAHVVAAADAAVVPSVWAEAFGLAALEPLSRAVPVVASRVGGLPEVVRHEVDGLLVEPGDEDALADALARLLGDPEARRRMGAAGRERARSEFSRSAQLDHLEAVFVEEMGL